MEITMYSREQLEEQSIANLLALPLTEIEDAVGFVLPPKGAYVINIAGCELGQVGKDDNAKEAITLDFEVATTVELENPYNEATKSGDQPVADGSKFGTAYVGGGSVQYFKTHYKDVAIALQAASVGALIEKLNQGVKVNVLIGHRSHTNDAGETNYYPTFSNITLV